MRRGDKVQFKRGGLDFEAVVLKVHREGDLYFYECMGTRVPALFVVRPRWLTLKRTWGDA